MDPLPVPEESVREAGRSVSRKVFNFLKNFLGLVGLSNHGTLLARFAHELKGYLFVLVWQE